MAVQAQQFGGLLLPPYAAEEQMRALKHYGAGAGATVVTWADDDGYAACQQYDYCAAQSELTFNGGGGCTAAVPVLVPSRKRGREDDDIYAPLLPLPTTGMMPSPTDRPAAASTSGRRADAPAAAEHALAASELWRHVCADEVDALVHAEWDRLRAGLLELARKRQRQALVRAAVSGLARRARDAETKLDAARRRAAELEERVRQAAAEAQAWCGVARGNEAVAVGLRATLDALLLRSSSPDDAQSSCCYVEEQAVDAAAAATAPASSSTWNGKWGCRACGDGQASVLLLPCRHLCLCKACEPRADACPVCHGAKNAAIHIAPN